MCPCATIQPRQWSHCRSSSDGPPWPNVSHVPPPAGRQQPSRSHRLAEPTRASPRSSNATIPIRVKSLAYRIGTGANYRRCSQVGPFPAVYSEPVQRTCGLHPGAIAGAGNGSRTRNPLAGPRFLAAGLPTINQVFTSASCVDEGAFSRARTLFEEASTGPSGDRLEIGAAFLPTIWDPRQSERHR